MTSDQQLSCLPLLLVINGLEHPAANELLSATILCGTDSDKRKLAVEHS
jgi:hypothetical protein